MRPRRLPVHVNFVIDNLSRAGTETQLLALIRAIDQATIQPTLTLLDGGTEESRSLEPPECPVLRLGIRSLGHPTDVARGAARLLRFWRRYHVDVVQTYFLDSTYFAVPLARLAGVRKVIRVRNNIGHWLTPKHRTLGRVIGRIADVTLTNSHPGRTALQRSERGNVNKLRVLENGVDLERFAKVPPPRRGQDIVTVGAIGNLRPVKGMDVLIRAAAMTGSARFVVAGEGEQRRELQALIDALGLTQRFRLLGRVDDIPSFLAAIDIAAVPSRAEGMSNALLEFLAAGRPVVATDVGANRQLLSGGQHGLLVPPDQPALLARALNQLIEDESLSIRLAAAGRRYVETHYDRQTMSLRFEEFYRRLVA